MELCTIYHSAGFKRFSVGQAQKWINMTLKYAVTFGEAIPGTARVFLFLHLPLDNIVLGELSDDCPKPKVAWSRLSDYSEYMAIQHWVRHEYPNETAIQVDFRLFQVGLEKSGGG